MLIRYFKVLLCLLIQSFIHETCIKYLLCPRPSAKHEGDRPEIRHGPCSEGIHILLCTTDLSQQLKLSGKCCSRYLMKHQEIGGNAPIHLREVQEKSDIWAGFCRMSRSSPNRQGKEECGWKGTAYADTSVYGVTPFTWDPDSIGSRSKFKALFNKQAKCKPNHNSFTDMSMLSPENLSTGCKYTVKFLESRRFLIQGTTRNLALWWREWLQYFVLSPGGIHREMKPPFYLVNHFQIYSLLTKGKLFS